MEANIQDTLANTVHEHKYSLTAVSMQTSKCLRSVNVKRVELKFKHCLGLEGIMQDTHTSQNTRTHTCG